ncbi:tripartite motif-containing protein 75-like [Cynocephalus volans]|uniref:tripartite motif-containing protein 75-like n=1 Tax=Cynocephalus volans TaxID=110931 RepID=UPI002FCBD7E2
MALAAFLAELQAEASCPMCLDYLRDPVTTDCGHNFCGSCIRQCWEDLQDVFPCPVCLHHCPDNSLKRNPQLCHMSDIVKQLPTTRSKRRRQEEKALCEQHSQVLDLFCEKDLELLCPQCRVTTEHRDHLLMPIEQAAASLRKRLKSYIEPLRKQTEDAEMGRDAQLSTSIALRTKVENWRGELHSQWEQLRQLLAKKQEADFLDLLMEEKDVTEKLSKNSTVLSQHISTLRSLLSEMSERCAQSDMELLTGIETIYSRYENLKSPAVIPCELKTPSSCLPPQYIGLQKVIDAFKAELTLDPETAHPNLIISEDRKGVAYGKRTQNVPSNPRRFTSYPAVLSAEGFAAGRHYWQVEVRSTGDWALGVFKESFLGNAVTSARPKDGCWQIEHWTSPGGTRDKGRHL